MDGVAHQGIEAGRARLGRLLVVWDCVQIPPAEAMEDAAPRGRRRSSRAPSPQRGCSGPGRSVAGFNPPSSSPPFVFAASSPPRTPPSSAPHDGALLGMRLAPPRSDSPACSCVAGLLFGPRRVKGARARE